MLGLVKGVLGQEGEKYPVASEPPVSVDRLPNETVCWRSVTIHDAAKSSTASEHQVLR